jgi:hypothetical protein
MIALNPGSFHMARADHHSHFYNNNDNKSSTAASKMNAVGNSSSSNGGGGQPYLFQGVISEGSPRTIKSQNNNYMAATSSVEGQPTNAAGESNYDSYMQIRK